MFNNKNSFKSNKFFRFNMKNYPAKYITLRTTSGRRFETGHQLQKVPIFVRKSVLFR